MPRSLVTGFIPLAVLLLVAGLSICGQANPPSSAESIRLIAAKEGVPSDSIEILALATAKDATTVLYRITPPATPSSPLGPLQMRFLVHPPGPLGRWDVAGGSPAEEPPPGCGATLHIRSGSGDTGHEINTVIYGVAGQRAATVEVTVRGTTYRRSLQGGGYIILLEAQGVQLSDIAAVHVFDEQGNELPIPCIPTALFSGG